MSEKRFKVNGVTVRVDVEEDTPLLWVLRENLQLTGTRFGCGIGQCGACTVHFNGVATRSCVLPVAACVDADVRTIENLGPHALQEAWIAEQVPQCGYCQSGQLMVAAKLLETNRSPSDADINAAMTNFCRCATYDRMRKAIKRAAKAMGPLQSPEPPPEPQVPEEVKQ
jgi:isoquinoline 1-oxidoreductase alpha subunit